MLEHKYYAKVLGLVLTIDKEASGREELLSVSRVSVPTSQNCSDLVDGQFSSRYGHDQLIGRVVGRIQVDVVEAIGDDDSKPAQALVAVDERMVANEGVEKCRSLAIQVGIGVVSVQNSTSAMSRRVEQAHIAHRSDRQVLHQRQEILERE